jgi:hypothetical protein
VTTPAVLDAAPAPAADAAPPAPSVADAIAAARARYAQGESITGDAPAPLPHHSIRQARDEEGQFAAPELRDAELDSVDPEAPLPPVPGEGEGQAPAGEPVVEEGPAPILVSLPGRREGDPDIQIEVTDPEVAEALQRQRNGYQRTEQVRLEREAIEKDKAERAEFVALVEQDPVAFVTQYVQPDQQIETAMFLLTQPQVWERVQAHLESMLQDPSVLQVTRAELKAARFESRDRIRQERETRERHQAEAGKVVAAVDTLVPQGLNEVQADRFHRDALADLSAYARRNNLQSLTPLQIVDALTPRLEAYGVDPLAAAASLRAPASTSSAPSPVPPARSTAKPVVAQAPVPGRRDALKAVARKVNAAVVPAPGSTSPSAAAGPLVKKGARVEDVIAEARKRLAGGGGLTS